MRACLPETVCMLNFESLVGKTSLIIPNNVTLNYPKSGPLAVHLRVVLRDV